MQEEYTYTPTLFSHDTEYLNNSPVSLNEDEIDSSIRDSLCKLKNLHPFETTCQTSLRKLIDTFTDLKETFNEIPILHSQSWRNKGMNISLASRISRIPWNRVSYPSLNTNNTFYYKNISYHVVSLESRY